MVGRAVTVLPALLALAVAGCPAPAKKKLPPPDPNKPLVVDWGGAEHLDIEEASKRGPVIIRQDGERYSILGNCNVKGPFGYEYIPAKGVHREHIIFESAEDVEVWLPFRPLTATFSMSNEEFVGLSMLSVGHRRLRHFNGTAFTENVGEIKRSSLPDGQPCRGATHFVSTIYIGAFRSLLIERSVDKASLEGILFGASFAKTEAVRSLRQQGDFSACEMTPLRADETNFIGSHAHDVMSNQPRKGCQFALRLELAELDTEMPPEPHGRPPEEPHEPGTIGSPPPVPRRPTAPTGWTIQAASYASVAKAKQDTGRFLAAGFSEFWFADQENTGVILIGSYPSFGLAEDDAKLASKVTGETVNVVNYPRWCPARESTTEHDVCSIRGILLDFTSLNLQAAKDEKARYEAQGKPVEILKDGSIYRLSRGPFRYRSDAKRALADEGLGGKDQFLEDMCPARQPNPDGYFTCGTSSPRSHKVRYVPDQLEE
jgi:hypothetical protein